MFKTLQTVNYLYHWRYTCICEMDTWPQEHELLFFWSVFVILKCFFISSNVQEQPKQENITKTEEPDRKVLPRMLFNLPSRNATTSSPSESGMYYNFSFFYSDNCKYWYICWVFKSFAILWLSALQISWYRTLCSLSKCILHSMFDLHLKLT